MIGPYEGLTVLELGDGTACAYAGQLLADRGATVIKVEPPEGDGLRWRSPHRDHESKAFQWLARGKQSIVVDVFAVSVSPPFGASTVTVGALVSTPIDGTRYAVISLVGMFLTLLS